MGVEGPEDEKLVAGPGVVGTKSMASGAAAGALAGAAIGFVIALVVGYLAMKPWSRPFIITLVVGGFGGAVMGFTAGGFLRPRQTGEAEEEQDV